jgi:hypothetical protein
VVRGGLHHGAPGMWVPDGVLPLHVSAPTTDCMVRVVRGRLTLRMTRAEQANFRRNVQATAKAVTALLV